MRIPKQEDKTEMYKLKHVLVFPTEIYYFMFKKKKCYKTQFLLEKATVANFSYYISQYCFSIISLTCISFQKDTDNYFPLNMANKV